MLMVNMISVEVLLLSILRKIFSRQHMELFLARRDYVPGETLLSPSRWRGHLSASASASVSTLFF